MIILIIILVLLALWAILTYNKLVSLRTETQSSESIIDTMSKRRYDLIPNLVNTVKGYAAHESGVLENVTKQRAAVGQASNLSDKVEANQALTKSVTQLFAIAENYPELKANQNFLALQEELTTTENKIAGARTGYTAAVNDYNTKIQTFPAKIIANFGGFKPAEYIKATYEEKEVPTVKF